jgi:hypothetical protein
MSLNTSFLFASLFWGTVGVGYFIYGKKQQSMMPIIGGVIMIAVSYLVSSAILMSLICLALCVGIYVLVKKGL